MKVDGFKAAAWQTQRSGARLEVLLVVRAHSSWKLRKGRVGADTEEFGL